MRNISCHVFFILCILLRVTLAVWDVEVWTGVHEEAATDSSVVVLVTGDNNMACDEVTFIGPIEVFSKRKEIISCPVQMRSVTSVSIRMLTNTTDTWELEQVLVHGSFSGDYYFICDCSLDHSRSDVVLTENVTPECPSVLPMPVMTIDGSEFGPYGTEVLSDEAVEFFPSGNNPLRGFAEGPFRIIGGRTYDSTGSLGIWFAHEELSGRGYGGLYFGGIETKYLDGYSTLGGFTITSWLLFPRDVYKTGAFFSEEKELMLLVDFDRVFTAFDQEKWIYYQNDAGENQGSYVSPGWRHVTLVSNKAARTTTLYIDGELYGQTDSLQLFDLAAIGNSEPGEPENALVVVDSVALYNCEMSAEQIKDIFDKENNEGVYADYPSGWNCTNGVRDGDETDVDCGGERCSSCDVGQGCLQPHHCLSGVCDRELMVCLNYTCFIDGDSHYVLGNGLCDLVNNNPACHYDYGDCCDSTCNRDTLYQCTGGFDCRDTTGYACEFGCPMSYSCKNGGICVDGTCVCPKNFDSYDCSEGVGTCFETFRCLNGGKCLEDGSCDCPFGFYGFDCSGGVGQCGIEGNAGNFSCVEGTCESKLYCRNATEISMLLADAVSAETVLSSADLEWVSAGLFENTSSTDLSCSHYGVCSCDPEYYSVDCSLHVPAVGLSPDRPADSCLHVRLSQDYNVTSGVYWLNPGGHGIAFTAYCEFPGDWQLVMKASSRSINFTYDSTYWTTPQLLASESIGPFIVEDAKLHGFIRGRVNQFRIGVLVENTNPLLPGEEDEYVGFDGRRYYRPNYINLPTPEAGAPNELFSAGQRIGSSLSTQDWLSLFPKSMRALQCFCNLGSINVDVGMRVRLGVIGNDDAGCAWPESVLGIGLEDRNAGNVAVWCDSCCESDGADVYAGFLLWSRYESPSLYTWSTIPLPVPSQPDYFAFQEDTYMNLVIVEDWPRPRPRAGSVMAGGYFWLFGGGLLSSTSAGPAYNDLWRYDLYEGTWTEIYVVPEARPQRRSFVSLIELSSLELMMFGGTVLNDELSDTWVFSFLTTTWTELTDAAPVGDPDFGYGGVARLPDNTVLQVSVTGAVFNLSEARMWERLPHSAPACGPMKISLNPFNWGGRNGIFLFYCQDKDTDLFSRDLYFYTAVDGLELITPSGCAGGPYFRQNEFPRMTAWSMSGVIGYYVDTSFNEDAEVLGREDMDVVVSFNPSTNRWDRLDLVASSGNPPSSRESPNPGACCGKLLLHSGMEHQLVIQDDLYTLHFDYDIRPTAFQVTVRKPLVLTQQVEIINRSPDLSRAFSVWVENEKDTPWLTTDDMGNFGDSTRILPADQTLPLYFNLSSRDLEPGVHYGRFRIQMESILSPYPDISSHMVNVTVVQPMLMLSDSGFSIDIIAGSSGDITFSIENEGTDPIDYSLDSYFADTATSATILSYRPTADLPCEPLIPVHSPLHVNFTTQPTGAVQEGNFELLVLLISAEDVKTDTSTFLIYIEITHNDPDGVDVVSDVEGDRPRTCSLEVGDIDLGFRRSYLPVHVRVVPGLASTITSQALADTGVVCEVGTVCRNGTAGVDSVFSIHLRDQYENPVDDVDSYVVTYTIAQDAWDEHEHEQTVLLASLSETLFEIHFSDTSSGLFQISVYLNDDVLHQTPFLVEILPAEPFPGNTEVTGPEGKCEVLQPCVDSVVNRTTTFYVTLKDQFGNVVSDPDVSAVSIHITSTASLVRYDEEFSPAVCGTCDSAMLEFDYTTVEAVGMRVDLLLDEEESMNFLICARPLWAGVNTSISDGECISFACDEGHYFNADRMQCGLCPPGTFGPVAADTESLYRDECEPCLEGRIAAASGAVECVPCSTGTYQPEPRKSSCMLCAEKERTAEFDAYGRLTDIPGATGCNCSSGFYRVDEGSPCMDCPDSCLCPGATVQPYAEPDYWREESFDSEGNYKVFKCRRNACGGGNFTMPSQLIPNTCVYNHKGRMCHYCQRGYWPLTSQCYDCGSEGDQLTLRRWIKLIGVMFVWLPFLRKLLRTIPALYIILPYLQVMTLIGQYNVDWSSTFIEFVTLISVANFDINMTEYKCYLPDTGFYFNWMVNMSLPFVYIMLSLLLFAWRVGRNYVSHLAKAKLASLPSDSLGGGQHRLLTFLQQKESETVYESSLEAMSFYMLTLNMLYLSCVTMSFQIFVCGQFSGNTWYLVASPDDECSGDSYQITWVLGVMGLVFYLIGVPLLFHVCKARARAQGGGYARVFGFLYIRYEDEYYWWETVAAVRRSCVAAIRTFVVGDPLVQLVATGTVIVTNVMAQFYARPYLKDRYDVLECFLLGFTYMILVTGVLLKDRSSEFLRELPVLLFIASVLVMIPIVVLDIREHMAKLKETNAAEVIAKARARRSSLLGSKSSPDSLTKSLESASRSARSNSYTKVNLAKANSDPGANDVSPECDTSEEGRSSTSTSQSAVPVGHDDCGKSIYSTPWVGDEESGHSGSEEPNGLATKSGPREFNWHIHRGRPQSKSLEDVRAALRARPLSPPPPPPRSAHILNASDGGRSMGVSAQPFPNRARSLLWAIPPETTSPSSTHSPTQASRSLTRARSGSSLDRVTLNGRSSAGLLSPEVPSAQPNASPSSSSLLSTPFHFLSLSDGEEDGRCRAESRSPDSKTKVPHDTDPDDGSPGADPSRWRYEIPTRASPLHIPKPVKTEKSDASKGASPRRTRAKVWTNGNGFNKSAGFAESPDVGRMFQTIPEGAPNGRGPSSGSKKRKELIS
eukprot:Rmarinus@m.2995